MPFKLQVPQNSNTGAANYCNVMCQRNTWIWMTDLKPKKADAES